MRFFEDTVDRTHTIKRYDGHSILVAPSSLVEHGLRNGQTLSKDEWRKIGITLAREWLAYVEQTRESGSKRKARGLSCQI
jgi:hypothetical protein